MTSEDFTSALSRLSEGQPNGRVSSHLLESLYSELRSLAGHLMRQERFDHTLQPTALVHEAFLRLVDARKVGERGRLHFLDAAAVTMRRVLVDHARAAQAQKRGGGQARERVTLGVLDTTEPVEEFDVLALHNALEELQQLDARQAKIIELRFFGGMSGREIAEQVGVSRATVVRELELSRAWLRRALAQRAPD